MKGHQHGWASHDGQLHTPNVNAEITNIYCNECLISLENVMYLSRCGLCLKRLFHVSNLEDGGEEVRRNP